MATPTHSRVIKSDDDDELDPIEQMMKRTGCLELHYKVQECIAETKDWRKCQKEVNDFKKCYDESRKRLETS